MDLTRRGGIVRRMIEAGAPAVVRLCISVRSSSSPPSSAPHAPVAKIATDDPQRRRVGPVGREQRGVPGHLRVRDGADEKGDDGDVATVRQSGLRSAEYLRLVYGPATHPANTCRM